jgi:polyribonucleotide nucleotidyltransferase
MMQVVITAISEFKQELNINDSSYEPPTVDKELYDNISNEFSGKIHEAYSTKDKLSRYKLLDEIKAQAIDKFASEERLTEIVKKYLHDLEAKQVRNSILKDGVRIDGRDLKTVRKISVETGILPGAHGSCLFTRGETQAIVVSTLGSDKDKQMIDSIDDAEQYDYFMFHYNFPPYSVGQISNQLSPKRREIGHGKLARRSLEAVLPTYKEFPYVTRVVSEITESNGSSSMASVCGASLSMMDAGIPVKKPVSGIAMGLIKEGEEFAVLTDILGDEDHLGDMDFKVAGTKDGITALQMDIKIDGITTNIMEKALEQAKEGRIHLMSLPIMLLKYTA